MKKKEAKRAQVRRITIDERLNEDLVKIGVARLLPGHADLCEDTLDSWSEEEVRLIHPSTLLRTLGLRKSAPLVKKAVNLLNCSVIKVSHHGSMHSAPLDVYERMSPALAILSSKQEQSSVTHHGQTVTRTLYPHPVAIETLRESGSDVLSTDGYFEWLTGGGNRQPGTIVVAVAPGKKPRYTKLSDDTAAVPTPPAAV